MTDRRTLLKSLAAATLAGAVLPRAAQAQAAEAGLISTSVCSLYTEVTEGPFYVDPGLVRSDIREDRPGVALGLRMQVVRADCSPVPGARVDIWQCDAQGAYSGVRDRTGDPSGSARSLTFLRGTQIAGDDGQVRFWTIYPGWYPGRTTHIHFKVFVSRTEALTGQIFFSDEVSQSIFDAVPAYDRDRRRDTLNRNDGIAKASGAGAYARLARDGDGYDAAIVVGIAG